MSWQRGVTSESEHRLALTKSVARLQDEVDAAEQVAPLSRVGRLVVGGWIAFVAQLMLAGGLAPDDYLAAATLWVLTPAGWGYVVIEGSRFVLARMDLRRLRRALAVRLEWSHAEEPQGASESLLPHAARNRAETTRIDLGFMAPRERDHRERAVRAGAAVGVAVGISSRSTDLRRILSA